MKMSKILSLLSVVLIAFPFFNLTGQEVFYKLTNIKSIETSDARELRREGICWSNAGTAFLEAELLRLGKTDIRLSELAFVHSLYMKKAEIHLQSAGKLRVDPTGMPYNVITLAAQYGIVPEKEYLFPEEGMLNSREKQGEMDAIIRGTLQMVIQNEGGNFTERWKNMYSTSLLRYLGEPKISFTYNRQMLNPKSFVDAIGLIPDDYILITSDPDSKPNTHISPDIKNNWAEYDFNNVSIDILTQIVAASINNGYPVLWNGAVKEEHIYVDEQMAIIPAGMMPGAEKENDEEEIEYAPVAELDISDEMRRTAFQTNIGDEHDYLLIFGINQDQEENTYFEAKYACGAENKTLNLSEAFIQLNTIYIMMNKNGIPDNIRKQLKF
jgi:bleomycin hydrolase